MKITASLIRKFQALAGGQTVPASQLRGSWVDDMLMDGVLVIVTRGSRKSLRALDRPTFLQYLSEHYRLRDLDIVLKIINKEVKRAELAAATGDSKFRSQRTFSGFLVNALTPVHATLNGRPITIAPTEGTYTFIADYPAFEVSRDTIIIGVENAENFRYLSYQQALFDKCLPKDKPWLFVSRYPQEQSKDLIRWLADRPNKYIHFGDLDLTGVSIYLTEYYKHLSQRASMLIPPDYKERLAQGSQDRYNTQLTHFADMEITDEHVQPLVDAIHEAHRGYDQEGYIESRYFYKEPNILGYSDDLPF